MKWKGVLDNFMAFQATHIRFALALQKKYEVKNLMRYVSGTVYPDSRYISGINRQLTHRNDLLDASNAPDDFLKGWAVHVLCDKVQHDLFMEELSDLIPKERGEDWWIRISAIKLVQDMIDFDSFDMEANLDYLNHAENRSGEPIEAVKLYNTCVQEVYRGKKHDISVHDYEAIWSETDIHSDLIDAVIKDVLFLQQDENILSRISSIYEKIVARSL